MATGTMQASMIYPSSSGLNAGAYDSRTFNLYPFGAAIANSWVSGALSLGVPSIPSYSDSGTRQLSFGDDWFNRIHISTALLALGNLVTAVTNTVKVWNAWLGQGQTLTAFNAVNDGGITVTPPGSLPLSFKPNQELPWTFAIGTDGPPTIDATYTWVFSDFETVHLEITGNRITAWALTPDWAQGVREILQWKTDVMIAWSGAEQRRCLRLSPRREFNFSSMMKNQERRVIEASLFAWSSMMWALPVFSDGQRLPSALSPGAMSVSCDTVNRDFRAGGLAILITDAANFEVLQITSLTGSSLALTVPVAGTWPAGSRLYPVRTARLASYPKITRSNSQLATVAPTFITVDTTDFPAASGLPSYRGYPVLENSPDDGANAEASYERESNLIDNDTGVVEMDDTAGIGFPTWNHAWFMQGRSQRAFFRSLMYLLKGRQGEIWVPTYQSDLELVAATNPSSATIDVEMTNYTLLLSGQINRQDIRIELTNGTILYRRITGSTILSSTSERLSIDSAVGVTFTPAQVRRISYMVLSRLNSDNIEIQHVNGDNGLAIATTPWRGTNHNV